MTTIEQAVLRALNVAFDSATKDDAFLFMAALADEGYEVVNRVGFIRDPERSESR